MSTPEIVKLTQRGTTNGNQRGSSYSRQRRREWLVLTYRADVDVVYVGDIFTREIKMHEIALGMGLPACRCYRCGKLQTSADVSVDRIIPGCHGGTYRHDNIRPACLKCNSATGGATRKKAA